MIDLDRTSDVELLRQVAKVQDAEIRRLHEKINGLVTQLAESSDASPEAIAEQLRLLRKELEESHRKTFGGGSERRPNDKDGQPDKPKQPQTGHGPKAQPELPITEVVHELDAADQACPKCGGHCEEWKGQFEESEEIDVVGIQYVMRKHKRKKYRCDCGHVDTALGVDKVIPGGRYSLDFAVQVATSRYADSLPLDRQRKMMKRVGLVVETQTLWDQVWGLARYLDPLRDRLHRYLLAKEVVLADETRWPLLGAKGRKTKNWFIWGLVSDDAALYRIEKTRSNAAGYELLRGYRGVVVADGYIVYESIRATEGFTLANDWSHVRRKFIDSETSAPEQAATFISEIGELFLIERDIKAAVEGLDPLAAKTLRAQVRDERSKPVVNRIGAHAMNVTAFRDSPLAKAVKYLENRWKGLTVFLADGRVPITSNAVEAALRLPVLGRKNSLGSRSERGINVTSLMYSLIGSANMNGLDPADYLRRAARAAVRGDVVPLPHELV